MQDRQENSPHENDFRGNRGVVPTARLIRAPFFDIAKQWLTSFDERDNCEDQEKQERNLADQGSGAGKTAETQKRGDERNDEEDNA